MMRLIILSITFISISLSANPLLGKWEFDKNLSWNSKEVKQLELNKNSKKQVLIYFSVLNKMTIEFDQKSMTTSLKSDGKSKYHKDLYTIVKKEGNSYFLKLSGNTVRYLRVSIEDKDMRVDLDLDDKFKKQSDAPPVFLTKKEK